MKNFLYPFTLAALAACQHTAPPVAKTVATTAVPTAALQKAKLTNNDIAPADVLTPEMLALLQNFDLAPLWAADTAFSDGYPTMVGFLGHDHYSVSLLFDEVARDINQPQLFHVRGRDRFHKIITPFEGTIQIQRIADFDSCYVQAPEEDSARVYTASAVFTFKQAKQRQGAGVFSGQAFLDFYITNKGYCRTPEVVMGGIIDKHTPTKGSGRLLRGAWTGYGTGDSKPFLVANDLFVIAPEVYSDFGVGDRGTQVNPKYAKQGWTDYWENEEWWAASPKPSLSL
ncbi:hypothetical protein MUN81_15175 [Hymenobacter sp. 5317J-9]|uniref:hypothetical protein n=1 Tax=Hymenobacter sp. 5317J-9 TaxID=2932250 RepID=UPI001FD72379|nr:hypothetical protein [Hymenobacter sp. 5317J-9]UOQ96579.1 hypothetical protein MUN81_15175 [Hymenobacter sp. 5317J-9]